MRFPPALLALAALSACAPKPVPEVATPPSPEVDASSATDPAPLEPASIPVFGGTLALDPSGLVAWAGDPENDRIFQVDLQHQEIVAVYDLPEGSLPFRIVATEGAVYASLRGTASLGIIDPATGELSVVPANCPEPRGLAWDEGRESVWLACASREIIRFEPDGTEVARFQWRPDLRDVAVLDDGTIAVSRFRAAEIGLFDDRGNLEQELVPPTVSHEMAGATADFAPEVAWRMFVDRGALVLLHQRATTATIQLAKSPPVGESPYGGDAGGPSACNQITHPAMTRFPIDGYATTTAPISGDTLAVDAAWDAPARHWVVADAAALDGESDVSVVEPDELVLPGNVRTVSCTLSTAGTDSVPGAGAVAVAVDALGQTVALGQSPFRVTVDAAEVPLGSATIQPDRDASVAFSLFTGATPSGLACESCHPEGQDDGHVWHFNGDVGARRTQNLAVGIARTLPLHWDGEFDTVQSLLDDVLVNRMGGASPGSLDGARLLDWIDALRPVRTTPEHPELVAAGAAVFADAGCDGCHAGAELTDNESVDVGTGLVAQVPSLVGVGGRGPWIHTGCADTLQDRFDPACGGRTHAAPDPADVDALVAYLETL